RFAVSEGHADGILLRRLARRRDRGEVLPPPRPARPGGRLRPQAERSRDARHPGRLQHVSSGGATTGLARSGEGAGPRRDVGRRAGRLRTQLGRVLALRLASLYVRLVAQALAASYPRAV